MTIQLPTADTLEEMCRAVYAELIRLGCVDLANEAVVVRAQARDVQEYAQAVLRLSDELRFDWGGA